MGRIKTQLVKRLTFEVVRNHRDKLTADFEENKQKVGELLQGASKKMRNVVAGYATRIVKTGEEV